MRLEEVLKLTRYLNKTLCQVEGKSRKKKKDSEVEGDIFGVFKKYQ